MNTSIEAGTLPCHDCDGVRAQLDLWPDGVFHLSRAGEGTPGKPIAVLEAVCLR